MSRPTNIEAGKATDAPHPWKIEDHTSRHGSCGTGYISIVDAMGRPICDFFPFAGKNGRGKNATLNLARQIIDWERAGEPWSDKQLADALRYQWLRRQSVGYPTIKTAIRFPVVSQGGEGLRAPKGENEVDAWIDAEMVRFP